MRSTPRQPCAEALALASALVLALNPTFAIAAPVPSAPGWVFAEDLDPLTDARRATATLTAESGAIVFKCDQNGTGRVYAAIVPAPPYLGPSRGDRSVQLRVDDGPVRDDIWMYSSDVILKPSLQSLRDAENSVRRITGEGGTVAVGMGVNAIAPEVARAKRFVARVFDYRFSTIDVVLLSDGNDSAIRRVYAACGDTWPSGS